MAFKKRRRGYSKGYPKQPDTFFDVEILDDNRIEVRSLDRDDYVILPMSKTLNTKLTKKKDNIVGNVYRVEFEDILLETDMNMKGIIAADSIVGKVVKKKLINKVKRIYTPNGKHNEYSDFQPTKGNYDVKEIKCVM